MNKHWYRIENKTGTVDVHIYDELGIGRVTAKDILDDLAKVDPSSELRLYVNSPGGSYFDGVAVANALRNWKGPKSAYVEGLAASAATVPLTVVDRVYAYENSLLMVHQASTGIYGNAGQLKAMSEALDRVNTGLLAAYAGKTKQPEATIREWLSRDTYFDAKEALQVGLVDEVLGPARINACAYRFQRIDAQQWSHPVIRTAVRADLVGRLAQLNGGL